MKKGIAILLALAILAGMTGCGNKQEIEFGAKIYRFMQETSINAGAIHTLCYIESECLREDGIGAEEQNEEYFDHCIDRYNEWLTKWSSEGDDVSDNELAAIIDRANWIQEEYPKIMEMQVKAENREDLQDAVNRLYEAHQQLLAISTTLTGPADDFYKAADDAFTAATDARKDCIKLLEPYYQKPGYSKLIY